MNPIQGASFAARSTQQMRSNFGAAAKNVNQKPMQASQSVAKKSAAVKVQLNGVQSARVAPSIAKSANLRARAGLMQRAQQPSLNTAQSKATVQTVDPATLENHLMGDVNGDGSVSRADGQALMDYLFNGGKEPMNLANADVDGDGHVNVADAIQMMNMDGTAQAEPEMMLGDVNGDGSVTQADGQALMDYLFNGSKEGIDMAAADMDGDGNINIADAIQMMNQANGSNEASAMMGDLNGDGKINESDSDDLTSYLFDGGKPPENMEQADLNGDGNVDISDLIQLLQLQHPT